MTFDEAVAVALGFPDAELSTSYGQPAVKANGNAFLFTGREPAISFGLRIEMGLKLAMLETFPDTFFETPHYAGYPAVLVRYDGPDEDAVRDMIASACAHARARKPPRPRRR